MSTFQVSRFIRELDFWGNAKMADDLPECKRKREDADSVDNEGGGDEELPAPKKANNGEPEKAKEEEPELLWHFEWDTWRSGVLEGLFFAKASDVDRAERKNKTVSFGDALGKHSDVEVEFSALNVGLATAHPRLIAAQREIFAAIGRKRIGYDPMEILAENEENEAEEASSEEDKDLSHPETPAESA